MGFWNIVSKQTDVALGDNTEKSASGIENKRSEAGIGSSSAVAVQTRREPEDKLVDRFGKIRSALGPGTVIQGRLSFDSVVRIDGRLSGDIFSSKPLIIGTTGYVDAQIEVASLIVLGTVRGKVRATERIEVWAGGQLEAEVTTPSILIEEGAVFSGSCVMPSIPKKIEGAKALVL